MSYRLSDSIFRIRTSLGEAGFDEEAAALPALREACSKHRKRIKRLEKRVDLWKDLAWITDEQIDRAVSYLNAYGNPVLREAAWRTLNNIGILRCEWQTFEFECAGRRGTATRLPPEDYRQIPICPECGGRGWVKSEQSLDILPAEDTGVE